MDYYAGIDVSLEAWSLCVVDASGALIFRFCLEKLAVSQYRR